MDHRELAAASQRKLRRKHAALRVDHVPDLHLVRHVGEKPFLVRRDYRLVDSFAGSLQQFVCARLVGVLMVSVAAPRWQMAAESALRSARFARAPGLDPGKSDQPPKSALKSRMPACSMFIIFLTARRFLCRSPYFRKSSTPFLSA